MPLEPQVFDVLAYLIQNRERVVSKDDLLASIWEGRSVSKSALTTRINAARSAIGDSGDQQRLIKTLQRKGIRFIGAVREEDRQTAAGEPILVALPDRPSIAVLAFTNMSGSPDQDYFSDGITEDIITELSRFSELLVIARNSSFQYKGKSVDIRQVGRELGVRYALEGSIRRAGDRIRISAQLIDATTGAHLWADRYDRKLDDTFAVQDEVVRTIVAVLAVHVNKAETERALAKPPAVWLAYDHYLRAAHTLALCQFLVQQGRASAGAARLGPGAGHRPQLRSGLCCPSRAQWSCGFVDGTMIVHGLRPSTPAYQELAKRCGWTRTCLSLTWRSAGHRATCVSTKRPSREFERATQLNPNSTDYHFAFALLVAGEPAKAIQTLEAHMRLDPFYQPRTTAMLGFAYYLLGRYLDALPHLQEAASRAPNHGHSRRIWPPMPSWASSTGPGTRPPKRCVPNLGSQSSKGSSRRSANAPSMPNVSAKGCARRDFRSDGALAVLADRACSDHAVDHFSIPPRGNAATGQNAVVSEWAQRFRCTASTWPNPFGPVSVSEGRAS